MMAIDTETTGLDFFHGARPFFFSSCDEEGNQTYWEWTVHPETRQPDIPPEDLVDIRNLLKVAQNWGLSPDEQVRERHALVLHNAKFDAHALASIGIEPFPWDMHHDTLLAGHVLDSKEHHDLTSMAFQYLGHDIKPFEKRLERAVKKARDIARHQFPTWRIAKDDATDMPSAKEETWRFDYWLPRAMMLWWSGSEMQGIKAELADHDDWWTVLSDYANEDTKTTIALWLAVRSELHRRRLWEKYLDSRRLPRIFYEMERRGVTYHHGKLRDMRRQYHQESMSEKDVCREIACAAGFELELPKSGMNTALRDFCFDHLLIQCPKCGKTSTVYVGAEAKRCAKCKVGMITKQQRSYLGLPVVARTETGAPSLDAKIAIPAYLSTLDGDQREFIRALASARKLDKSIESLVTYERFGLPYLNTENAHESPGYLVDDFKPYRVLHPSNNQTATVTLRTSQSNPNGQQISKQEAFCDICNEDGSGKDIEPDCWKCKGTGLSRVSIRTIFCPAPGREWWSMDYENIELRIPAYKAPEPAMVALFESPNDPPYFGSNHLLVAHKLHPRLFEQCRSDCPTCKGTGVTYEIDLHKSTELDVSLIPPHLKCNTCRGHGRILDGRIFKDRYKDTLYQYLKNGNFAVQYGAQEELADRTYHVLGAFKMLKEAFAGMAKLNQKLMEEATKFGYVKTALGYPLVVQRTEYGRPVPTQPLSYYVQGSAMECTRRAMVRCDEYLIHLNASQRLVENGYHMILLVHDELVFDMPYRENHGNAHHAFELARLMCLSGDEIGVPLTVNVEYHRESWGRREKVKRPAS